MTITSRITQHNLPSNTVYVFRTDSGALIAVTSNGEIYRSASGNWNDFTRVGSVSINTDYVTIERVTHHVNGNTVYIGISGSPDPYLYYTNRTSIWVVRSTNDGVSWSVVSSKASSSYPTSTRCGYELNYDFYRFLSVVGNGNNILSFYRYDRFEDRLKSVTDCSWETVIDRVTNYCVKGVDLNAGSTILLNVRFIYPVKYNGRTYLFSIRDSTTVSYALPSSESWDTATIPSSWSNRTNPAVSAGYTLTISYSPRVCSLGNNVIHLLMCYRNGSRYNPLLIETKDFFQTASRIITFDDIDPNVSYTIVNIFALDDTTSVAVFKAGSQFFIYTISANTPPVVVGPSVSSTYSPTPRISWTFSDDDLNDYQTGYRVRIYEEGVLKIDSGEVNSSDQYYDVPTPLTRDKHYEAYVTVRDSFGSWSAEAVVSWTLSYRFVSSGSVELQPIHLARVGAVNQGTISWQETVPEGTSIECYYSTSDDGSTWSEWTPVDNGGALPNAEWIKIKFELSTQDDLVSPELHEIRIHYPYEYNQSGLWESPVIDTGPAVEAYDLIRESYEASVPEGTTAVVEYRHSSDGQNWSDWKPLDESNNQWEQYIQLRLVLHASDDEEQSPVVERLGIKAPTAYYNTGVWTSPAIDIRNIEPGLNGVEWEANLSDSMITVEARVGYEEDEWGPWTAVPNSGAPIPLNMTSAKYLQIRAVLERGHGNDTPELDKIKLSIAPLNKKGFWTSEVIDVSQARDKTTGKVTSDISLGSDRLITRYKYSTDGGSTFSEWHDAFADGTLATPADTTHIKLMHVLIGNNVEVKSTTLFFDGEPAAEKILSNMTPNAEYDFTQIRDIVIIANGKDAPRKWNKIDPPSLLGGDPPAFQMVETHLNRAWGAGDPENPSRVRYSDILDPESWPALNFIDFNPEDGDKITALFRYGQVLVVSKRNSIALLTGDRTSNFAVQWLDHDAGAEGFRGIGIVDKYLAYVAYDGVRFSDLTKSVRVTERLKKSWDNLNQRRLNQAALVSKGNYMLVALPSKGSLVNDQVWFFDVLRAAWSIIPNWKVSCWLKFRQYGDEVLLAGDSETGQVYEVLTGVTDADGSYMEYDYISKDFDFGFPERYKVFRDFILIVGGVESETSVKVSFIVDGVEHEVPEADTIIPAGEGELHSIRLIPPVYGAVLGQRLAIRLRGRVHIHSMAIGVVIKGIVPGVS